MLEKLKHLENLNMSGETQKCWTTYKNVEKSLKTFGKFSFLNAPREDPNQGPECECAC